MVSNLSGIIVSMENGTSLQEATELIVKDLLSALEDVANEQESTEVLQLSQNSTMGWPQEQLTKPETTQQPSVN